MVSRPARITLSIGRASEGPRITGDINILGLLLALYQVWFSITILGASKTFDHPLISTDILMGSALPDPVLQYSFMASCAVFLIAIALLRSRIDLLFSKRTGAAVGAGLCCCACILLICFGCHSFIGGIVAGILAGLGAAIFICFLGRIYASLSLATSVINATISFAIAAICSIALINWIPTFVVTALTVLVPLLLFFALWKSYPQRMQNTPLNVNAPSPHLSSYLVRLGIASLVFGSAFGITCISCVTFILLSNDVTADLIFGASAVTSMLVFIFAMTLSRRETLWDSLFRIVGPFMIVGAVVFAFSFFTLNYLGYFAITLSYVCMQTLFWVFLASLSRQINYSSNFIYGLGFGLLQVGSIVGMVVANLTYNAGFEGLDVAVIQRNVALLALLIAVAIFISYSIFPRYSELRAILAAILHEKTHAANIDQEAEMPIRILHTVPASTTHTPEQPEKIAVSASPDVTPDLSSSPDTDSEEDAKPKKNKGSFIRRCEQIADFYMLSDRETEVLFLLAKGHNAAFILEKLCISRSTAKTHINHIYKKMNIHTQQELLNMVEERDRGPQDQHYTDGPAVGSMGAAVLQNQKALREATLIAKKQHDVEMAKAKTKRRS